jgi:TetR/AcrR family transcriptional regulator, repressor for neighboring sulfatase
MSRQRVRRSRDEARRLILEAAEQLLIEGGPAAVQVRAVAERVGMTDAGVYHHFGTRQSLLVALLRHGGRRLRRAVEEAAAEWAGNDDDVASLVAAIASLYAEGYAELAVALHAAGWSDKGGGLLEPVVQALHAAREEAGAAGGIDDTRLAVAALHQALALEPVYGRAFRRSAGIGARAAGGSKEQLAWWTATLRRSLGREPG